MNGKKLLLLILLLNVGLTLGAKHKSRSKHTSDDYYDDEDEKYEKNKIKPAADSEEAEEEDAVMISCGSNSCTCKDEILNCEKVVIDGEQLTTANVILSKNSKDMNIKHAIFKNNHIATLKTILQNHEQEVEILDFSDNYIEEIESEIFEDFKRLRVLILSHNKLTSLSKNMFLDLKTLHELHLDNNQIKNIAKYTFAGLTDLKTLVLDNNPKIELDPGIFDVSALRKLESLSLDYCNLKDIDDTLFAKLTNLKKLSLIGNPLVAIPNAINALPNLVGLDISNTQITEFQDGDFSDDHELQEFYAYDMPFLHSIRDSAFAGLSKLTVVDLHNSSRLYSINENAFGYVDEDPSEDDDDDVPILKFLNLKQCNISLFPENLIDWTALEKLSIHENPIECDCTGPNAWLVKIEKELMLSGTPTCVSPPELKGIQLRKLDGVCGNTGLNMIFAAFIIFMFIGIGIVLTLIMKNKIKVVNIFQKSATPQMGYSNLKVRENEDDQQTLDGDFHPRLPADSGV